MSRGLDPADHAAIVAGHRPAPRGRPTTAGGDFDHEYSCPAGRAPAGSGCRPPGSRRLAGSSSRHTDITEPVRSEQALAWQAGHDELTGLPNRATLLRADRRRARRRGPARRRGRLLVLDLDGFKTVNDSLGHEIGDALLCQVAARLAEQVRPGDAVGRLGGDQFVVLARECDSTEAAALAFRLQTTFSAALPGPGISVPLSASIGVAVSRPTSATRTSCSATPTPRCSRPRAPAATACTCSRRGCARRPAGGWRWPPACAEDAIDQLVVHYQPVVRLGHRRGRGRRGAGPLAAPRARAPAAGLLPRGRRGDRAGHPDHPLAAARDHAQGRRVGRQGLPLRMSVNVSARHFSAETLVRDVRVALRESGLPPDQLVLELTETSVAEDPTRAEDQLTVLRSFGVRVAIDDFGTGWSSLAQLFALPIGTLKIDRSLLNAAERAVAGETGAVLTAIVGLTRTLGIRSVAEGVETPEHLRMVRAAGCDLAQGWLLGQPMPADEIPGWCAAVQAAGGDLCAQPSPAPRSPGRVIGRRPGRRATAPAGPPRPAGSRPRPRHRTPDDAGAADCSRVRQPSTPPATLTDTGP